MMSRNICYGNLSIFETILSSFYNNSLFYKYKGIFIIRIKGIFIRNVQCSCFVEIFDNREF